MSHWPTACGDSPSHVPSIGAAIDHGKTEDAYWKPLFEGYAPAREWMAQHRPDVAIIIYNDHANAIDDTYHVPASNTAAALALFAPAVALQLAD